MKTILTVAGVMAAVAMTLASGLIHGRLDNRWGPPARTRDLALTMEQLPKQIGSWQSVESQELPAPVQEILQCHGSVSRTYVNQETGDTVRLSLLMGPHGPMAAHRPEVCYPSQNLRIVDELTQRTVIEPDGRENRFWKLNLQSYQFASEQLAVYYAWSTGNGWEAPSGPRWKYRAEPYLYKVQVAFSPRPVSAAAALSDQDSKPADASAPRVEDAGLEFLTEFVKAVRPLLSAN